MMKQIRQANITEEQIKEENKAIIQNSKSKNNEWEAKKKETREKNMKQLKEVETGEGKKVKILDIIHSEEESVESEKNKKQEINKKSNNENNIKEEDEENKKDSSSKNKITE